MNAAQNPGGHVPEETPDAPERTGETVQEAVDVAAAGTQHGGTVMDPEDAHPHGAPVEQVHDDPDMTGAGA